MSPLAPIRNRVNVIGKAWWHWVSAAHPHKDVFIVEDSLGTFVAYEALTGTRMSAALVRASYA